MASTASAQKTLGSDENHSTNLSLIDSTLAQMALSPSSGNDTTITTNDKKPPAATDDNMIDPFDAKAEQVLPSKSSTLMHFTRFFLPTNLDHAPRNPMPTSASSEEANTLHPTFGIIQVPAQLLNTLLMSVESLKKEVALVKSQNQELQTQLSLTHGDLRTLQKNSGVAFYFFPKLPIEIRQLIWRAALNFPRIIAVKSEANILRNEPYLLAASNSPPGNPIRQTCKEALVEAKAIQTSLYYRNWYDERFSADPFVFSNGFADILWFNEHEADDENWLSWGSIKPPRNNTLLSRNLSALMHRDVEPRIIAMPYEQWYEQIVAGKGWMMDFFARKKTKEIILIVDRDYEGADPAESPEVLFAPPTDMPSETLPEKFFHWRQSFGDRDEDLEWDTASNAEGELRWSDLAEEAVQCIGHLARSRLRSINKSQLLGSEYEELLRCILTLIVLEIAETKFENCSKHSDILHPSKWTIEKVHFMNARTVGELGNANGLSPIQRMKALSEIMPPR